MKKQAGTTRDRSPKTPFARKCVELGVTYRMISKETGIKYSRLSKIGNGVLNLDDDVLVNIDDWMFSHCGVHVTREDFIRDDDFSKKAKRVKETNDVVVEKKSVKPMATMVELLSSGYVIRDEDGWSEPAQDADAAASIIVERAGKLVQEARELEPGMYGYKVIIAVAPITNPSEFFVPQDRG